MTNERALEINGALVACAVAAMNGQDIPTLPDATLPEMCEASRIVTALRSDNTTYIHCDDRIIAALYAHQHFGGPGGLLHALGYELKKRTTVTKRGGR